MEEIEQQLFNSMQHEGLCDQHREGNKCFGSCVVDVNAEIAKNILQKALTAQRNKLRTKLRQALKEVHGSGNSRRILTQLLEEI